MWILICLFLAVLFKNARKKKYAILCGITLLLFFSNKWIGNRLISQWEMQTITLDKIEEPYDIGILLTGYSDNNMLIPNQGQLFNFSGLSANRFTQAVELYKLGKVKQLLISGGSGALIGNTISEAESSKQLLLRLGIPEKDILIELKSRNTHENALFTKNLLDQLHKSEGENLLLLTSAFHMYRAEKCFKKVGLSVTPFSVGFWADQTTKFYIVPDLETILEWQAVIKEWVGVIAYWLKGYI